MAKHSAGAAFGLMALSLAPTLAAATVAASYDLTSDGNAKFLADYAQEPGVVKLPDGLMYRIIRTGKGPAPLVRQDEVTVEYRGWRIDGKVFDQTKRGEPIAFTIGAVIPGWTEALMKMKTGDEWQVVIPAALAYGDRGAGAAIPPGQSLIFMIKLDKVAYAP